jgi:hypothetical protein
MARLTLRAVEQPDGRYRISITPAAPGVDVHRVYWADEVRELAERIHAEVRWVSARAEPSVEPEPPNEQNPFRGAEPSAAPPGWWGEESPAPEGAAPSDDPWGGTLSAGNED